jgi:hypothetical protein
MIMGPEPIIKTDFMELSFGIVVLLLKWRAKVIVIALKKKYAGKGILLKANTAVTDSAILFM